MYLTLAKIFREYELELLEMSGESIGMGCEFFPS
jgi:hypothetical protein